MQLAGADFHVVAARVFIVECDDDVFCHFLFFLFMLIEQLNYSTLFNICQ